MRKSHLLIDFTAPGSTIAPALHGQFIEQLSGCVNGGLWDAKTQAWHPEALTALRELGAPVLRWPGGCFADTYHWREGIGDRETRPKRVTTRWGWDDEEPNHVGTHEFMDLCAQTGASPWVNLNVATGSPQEATDWVEYCCFSGESDLSRLRQSHGAPQPFEIPYWGIGNECWDCGGKFTPREYAEAYRRFESSLPRFRENPLSLIICGPDGNKPAEREVWTTEVLERLHEWRHPRMYGLDLHWYNWGDSDRTGLSDSFDEAQTTALIAAALELGPVMDRQREILDRFNPNLALIVGEWGTWHPDAWKGRFRQAVTMRDATIISAQLDLFHARANQVQLATLTMACNVLSSPLQVTDGQVVRTPVYWAMHQHRNHRGRASLPVELKGDLVTAGEATTPGLSATVSRSSEGEIWATVTNLDPRSATEVVVPGASPGEITLLTHEDLRQQNTPGAPSSVTAKAMTGSLILPPARSPPSLCW